MFNIESVRRVRNNIGKMNTILIVIIFALKIGQPGIVTELVIPVIYFYIIGAVMVCDYIIAKGRIFSLIRNYKEDILSLILALLLVGMGVCFYL